MIVRIFYTGSEVAWRAGKAPGGTVHVQHFEATGLRRRVPLVVSIYLIEDDCSAFLLIFTYNIHLSEEFVPIYILTLFCATGII